MIRPEYLDINKIITDKSILKLFQAVASHGGILRFVGGAVRDVLAGMKGFEIDLATDLTPDELVEACQEAGLKTVPIGIKFATTGVVINNKIVEVSSLHKERKGYALNSEFDFTDDWIADASKRDLTINAVYADEKGNVFDYYNGISDLEEGVIRFIGNAEDRIKEDHIRIMRFFRFYSIFGKQAPDLKSLKACVENRDLLKDVAIEQVRDELFKILLTPKVVDTLRIIFENDILSYILPVSEHLDDLQQLSDIILQNHLEPDALRRLYILYRPDENLALNLAMRLHLAKEQKTRLVNWAKYDFDCRQATDEKALKKGIYLHGKQFCKDKILFDLAQKQIKDFPLTETFSRIENMEIPQFPISGSDLIELGIADKGKNGKMLSILKNEWIASDFRLNYQQLADIAKMFIQQNQNP